MAIDDLLVVRGMDVVAQLEVDKERRLALTYDPRVASSKLDAPLISTSLPVRKATYPHAEVLPFFDGLLPEGSVRDGLARRARVEPDDVFGLLEEVGRDCAGAFSIVPPGTDLAASEGVEWLDDEALAATVAELGLRPLGFQPAADVRISLAGAQDKLAVVVEDGRFGLPRGTTPSSHILKPESSTRRGRRGGKPAYPELVANEGFCLALARFSGIAAADASVILIDASPALILARHDRELVGTRRRRLHQEDFCQALGVPGRLKYEKDGGPDARRYLDLIQRWSSNVAVDTPDLIDRFGFNYLIGNADAHAKNFSLIHDPAMRLAPAYDLLSTHVYSQLTKDMATSINGIFDARAIQPIHWRKELERLEVSVKFHAERLAELANVVSKALPEAIEWAKSNALFSPRLEEIAQLVRSRGEVLIGVPNTIPYRPKTPPTKHESATRPDPTEL